MEQPPQAQVTPSVSYFVEVKDGNLQIRLSIGAKSIPVPVTPDQAATLAQALMAASALCTESRAVAPGRIEESDLPVIAWRTGVIRDHCLVVLIVDLLGGGHLTLQFQPAVAINCARSLLDTGEALKIAAG